MTEKRKKYIEQWWRKYEVMNAMEAELEKKFPTPPEVFYSLMNSVYRHWLKSGKSSVVIDADLAHHIAMQKVFKKWREVYDERV
jgi:hypothetical protein